MFKEISIALLLALTLAGTGCTDEEGSMRVLKAAGYTGTSS